MEIIQDHQKCAEECVMMALSSKRYSDKALWLILAQSWAQLAEQVAFTEGRDDLSRGIQRCRASNSLRDSRIELIVATSNELVGGSTTRKRKIVLLALGAQWSVAPVISRSLPESQRLR